MLAACLPALRHPISAARVPANAFSSSWRGAHPRQHKRLPQEPDLVRRGILDLPTSAVPVKRFRLKSVSPRCRVIDIHQRILRLCQSPVPPRRAIAAAASWGRGTQRFSSRTAKRYRPWQSPICRFVPARASCITLRRAFANSCILPILNCVSCRSPAPRRGENSQRRIWHRHRRPDQSG